MEQQGKTQDFRQHDQETQVNKRNPREGNTYHCEPTHELQHPTSNRESERSPKTESESQNWDAANSRKGPAGVMSSQT